MYPAVMCVTQHASHIDALTVDVSYDIYAIYTREACVV